MISEHKCLLVDPNIIILDPAVLFFSLYLWCLSVNKHSLNGAIRQSFTDFMQNMLILTSGEIYNLLFYCGHFVRYTELSG